MPRKLKVLKGVAGAALALGGLSPMEGRGEPLVQAFQVARETAAPKKDFSGQIPPERLREMTEQVRPHGWTLLTFDVGDGKTSWKWTVYNLRHEDGTLWQHYFPHRLFYQVRRILDPRWVPIENHDTDALLLERRESFHGTGWRPEYTLTPTATFPEINYILLTHAVLYPERAHRETPYESEFRFWLQNGPRSVWGPDRPFPNLPPPAPVTVSPDQIFEP